MLRLGECVCVCVCAFCLPVDRGRGRRNQGSRGRRNESTSSRQGGGCKASVPSQAWLRQHQAGQPDKPDRRGAIMCWSIIMISVADEWDETRRLEWTAGHTRPATSIDQGTDPPILPGRALPPIHECEQPLRGAARRARGFFPLRRRAAKSERERSSRSSAREASITPTGVLRSQKSIKQSNN